MRRGGITKAGNALARRALIEGAWTYRMQARVSPKLHDRNEKLPKPFATSAGRPGPSVRALSPARGGRQGEDRRRHRDCPRNGGLSVGDRLSGPTAQQPDGCKAVITAPRRAAGRGEDLAACYEPVLPALAIRQRQPQDETTVMRIEPAHESLPPSSWSRLPPWASL